MLAVEPVDFGLGEHDERLGDVIRSRRPADLVNHVLHEFRAGLFREVWQNRRIHRARPDIASSIPLANSYSECPPTSLD